MNLTRELFKNLPIPNLKSSAERKLEEAYKERIGRLKRNRRLSNGAWFKFNQRELFA